MISLARTLVPAPLTQASINFLEKNTGSACSLLESFALHDSPQNRKAVAEGISMLNLRSFNKESPNSGLPASTDEAVLVFKLLCLLHKGLHTPDELCILLVKIAKTDMGGRIVKGSRLSLDDARGVLKNPIMGIQVVANATQMLEKRGTAIPGTESGALPAMVKQMLLSTSVQKCSLSDRILAVRLLTSPKFYPISVLLSKSSKPNNKTIVSSYNEFLDRLRGD